MDFNKKHWFETISKGDVEQVRKLLASHADIINCCDVSSKFAIQKYFSLQSAY